MADDTLRWMPVDVPDWMLDPNVERMPAAARAGYFDLLCRQWYYGSLPDDDSVLKRFARLTEKEWKTHREIIMERFKKDSSGRLKQPRCERELDKAKYIAEQASNHGRLGASARWEKDRQSKTNAMPEHCPSIARAMAESCTDLTDLTDQPTDPRAREDTASAGGNGEEKHPPPRGTTTVFDQQAEITELLDRYTAGDDPFTPDPEDEANARKAIDQITAGSRPGAKLLFLRTLAQFEPLQVCMAAHDWLNLPDLPTGDPKGYFIGMVRGSGKRKYVRYADRVEVKRERTQQDARKREARGKDKPVDQPPPDASPVPGVHRVGDVLRNLPAVRRARTTTRQTPPEKADDVPDSG